MRLLYLLFLLPIRLIQTTPGIAAAECFSLWLRTWSLYKVSEHTVLSSLSWEASQPGGSTTFSALLLFLLPVPGNGRIISGLQEYYCKRRSGRCALIGCLPNEEQIGHCFLSGRKCCRKKE